MVEFYLVSSKRQIKTQKETEQQNFTVILDIKKKKKLQQKQNQVQ